jgi:hypothetical protein
MSTARIMAYVLLLYGAVLHTYTHLVRAASFSVGWWLWSLSPYIAGGLILILFRRPHATAGALMVPALLDAGNFYSVFIHPEGSTASLGLLFVPLWNLVAFVPVGAAIGWWVGNRVGIAGKDMPSNKSLERKREE